MAFALTRLRFVCAPPEKWMRDLSQAFQAVRSWPPQTWAAEPESHGAPPKATLVLGTSHRATGKLYW